MMIMRLTKSRKMSGMFYVVCMAEKRNACKLFVKGRQEGRFLGYQT